MNIKTILVTALTAGSLFAQAPDKELDARIQIYGEAIRPSAFTLSTGETPEAARSFGLGLRFMGEVGSAENWYYEVGGKLDSSSKLNLNDANVNLTDIRITQSYWVVGGGYLVPLGKQASLGFHFEGRGEALAAQGAVFSAGLLKGRVDSSSTYLRPWGRLTLDASFYLGTLHPFVGLEVAGTPVKTTQTQPIADLTQMDSRTLRALAPNVSAAFYVGLHL